MVSAILGKPVLDRTVVLGEMSVQGMLLKVNALPERMQLAVESGAKRILIPSEKRDVADVPDAVLTAIQWQFYDSPTRAAILALGLAERLEIIAISGSPSLYLRESSNWIIL